MKRVGLFLLGALALLRVTPACAADTVYYYSSDTLHSEVVVTDQNRNVVERTYYAPYGAVLNRDLRDGPGYTGHEEDPETSLVYMQQRYYDPDAGRFLSTDPVLPTGDGGSFNRYEYAEDNPYRYTDPTGMASNLAEKKVKEIHQTCTGSHIGGGACGAFGPLSSALTAANAAATMVLRQAITSAAPKVAAGIAEAGGVSALTAIGTFAVGVAIPNSTATDDTVYDENGRKREEKVVIGEGMTTRVIPFASSIGADYYHGAPEGTPESGYMSHNRAWINAVMDEHQTIINIGPESGREFYPNPTSSYYKMELEQIKIRNYPVINADVP